METTNTIEGNSYLALREAKIARNHARLQELGLTNGKKVRKRVIPQSNHSQILKKSKSSETKETSLLSAVVKPTRRSSRLNTPQADIYVKPLSSSVQQATKPLTLQQLSKLDDVDLPLVSRKDTKYVKNSAREMQLDVAQLLFGSLNEGGVNGLLGTQLTTTGKAFVMEESARQAVSKETTTPISFNKYCGAQEWGNNVIYLWINFGFPGGEVVNKFDSNGRQVNWYGGSKMHDRTPLIQKLKTVGVQAAQKLYDTNGAVVLWCRCYNMTKKGFDPYVCFGRLSLISYDHNSHPVQFVWNLIDYEKILHHESNQVQETFQKFTAFK